VLLLRLITRLLRVITRLRRLIARLPHLNGWSPRANGLPDRPIAVRGASTTATNRSKPQTYQAIDQLSATGVLRPITASRRHRAWEPTGLLDLME